MFNCINIGRKKIYVFGCIGVVVVYVIGLTLSDPNGLMVGIVRDCRDGIQVGHAVADNGDLVNILKLNVVVGGINVGGFTDGQIGSLLD